MIIQCLDIGSSLKFVIVTVIDSDVQKEYYFNSLPIFALQNSLICSIKRFLVCSSSLRTKFNAVEGISSHFIFKTGSVSDFNFNP